MRFLSLLLAFVMVIGLMPATVLAAEGDGQPELTVTARYSTNRLSWNAKSGVTYTVERSEDNETWESIATASGGSYLDTSAGLGTRYYYRVTADAQGVQGLQTGMAALKEIAVLFYVYRPIRLIRVSTCYIMIKVYSRTLLRRKLYIIRVSIQWIYY